MSTAAEPKVDSSLPHSQVEFKEVLERILASKHFKGSKRSSCMLRYVVENSLEDPRCGLKERTIGVEVFNRPLDYETTTDPVVRNVANEIRKRLAMYYMENSGEPHEIALPSGSYVATFKTNPVSLSTDTQLPEPELVPREIPPHSRKPDRRTVFFLLSTVGVLLVSGVFVAHLISVRNSTVAFWEPWLSSNKQVLICIGNIDTARKIAQPDTPASPPDWVGFAEVEAVSSISSVITPYNVHAIVRNATNTNLDEMRQKPIILVGGRTNPWTMRAMNLLPFQIVQGAVANVEIRERNPKGGVIFSDDLSVPIERRKVAYGLIARFRDPATDQITLIAAGVGPNGTIASVEFVTDPRYLREFTDHAPVGWEKKNVELIVESQLIDGKQGPPHLKKSEIW